MFDDYAQMSRKTEIAKSSKICIASEGRFDQGPKSGTIFPSMPDCAGLSVAPALTLSLFSPPSGACWIMLRRLKNGDLGFRKFSKAAMAKRLIFPRIKKNRFTTEKKVVDGC